MLFNAFSYEIKNTGRFRRNHLQFDLVFVRTLFTHEILSPRANRSSTGHRPRNDVVHVGTWTCQVHVATWTMS